MKRNIITGLFLLLSLLGFSQHEFDNWYFGYNVGITFKNGYPENLPPNSITTSCTATVTVSDSTGQVLFYSHGYNVRIGNTTITASTG